MMWCRSFMQWPGLHVVRVEGQSPDWFVKTVRVRGVAMPNQTVDFVAGKAIIGLEVEIARRRAPEELEERPPLLPRAKRPLRHR